jgi:GT2 family glycosyltransferase
VQASVVICTLNRSQALIRGLRALEAQTGVAPEQAELVVVDNGSTDATPTVVKEFRRYARFPVHWCVEERLGLSNARNRGVAESHHELVIFLDDDAVPAPGWVAAYIAAAVETQADCVGGRITLEWEAPRPAWLHPALDPFLSRVDLGVERCAFNFPRTYPVGCNIAFRRAVFEKVGLFDPALGVRPGRVVGSEETDMCYRIERAGGRVLYEPRAHVTHLVPAAKLSKQWFRRRAYHAGRTACLVELRYFSRAALLARNLPRVFARPKPMPGAGEPSAPSMAARLFLAEFRLLFALGYLGQLLRPR